MATHYFIGSTMELMAAAAKQSVDPLQVVSVPPALALRPEWATRLESLTELPRA